MRHRIREAPQDCAADRALGDCLELHERHVYALGGAQHLAELVGAQGERVRRARFLLCEPCIEILHRLDRAGVCGAELGLQLRIGHRRENAGDILFVEVRQASEHDMSYLDVGPRQRRAQVRAYLLVATRPHRNARLGDEIRLEKIAGVRVPGRGRCRRRGGRDGRPRRLLTGGQQKDQCQRGQAVPVRQHGFRRVQESSLIGVRHCCAMLLARSHPDLIVSRCRCRRD